MKLPNPYPSSPHRLPTHGIVISCGGRKFSTTFCACYAAKHFVNLVVKDGYKRISTEKLRTEDGVVLQSPELEEILKHKLSILEKEWEIPDHYKWQVFFVTTGRWLSFKKPKSYEASYSSQVSYSSKQSENSAGGWVVGGVFTQPPNRHQPTKANSQTSGKISIAEICKEIGIEPSKARRILRTRSDLVHARQGRWEWDDRDAEAIKQILRSKS